MIWTAVSILKFKIKFLCLKINKRNFVTIQ